MLNTPGNSYTVCYIGKTLSSLPKSEHYVDVLIELDEIDRQSNKVQVPVRLSDNASVDPAPEKRYITYI